MEITIGSEYIRLDIKKVVISFLPVRVTRDKWEMLK